MQLLLTLGLYAESLGVNLLKREHRPVARLIEQASDVLHLASELGVQNGMVRRVAKKLIRGANDRALGLTCAEFGTSLFLAIFNGPYKGYIQEQKPSKPRTFDFSKLSSQQQEFLLSRSPEYTPSIEQLKAAGARMLKMADLLQVTGITHPLELMRQSRLQPHWTRLATAPQKDQGSQQGGSDNKVNSRGRWNPLEPSGVEEFNWPEGLEKIPKWFTGVAPRMVREMHLASRLGPRGQRDFEPFVLWTKYVTDNIQKLSQPPQPPPPSIMQTMQGYAHDLYNKIGFPTGKKTTPNGGQEQTGPTNSQQGREEGNVPRKDDTQNREGARKQERAAATDKGNAQNEDSRFTSTRCICPKFRTQHLKKFADDLYSDGQNFAQTALEFYEEHIETEHTDMHKGTGATDMHKGTGATDHT